MSTAHGGMSDFEMGPNAYDIDRITEEVLWPLVNHAWHGGNRPDDWLVDSRAGDSISVFRRRRLEGQNLKVVLEARTDTSLDNNDIYDVVRSLSLKIEHEATGGTREVLMNRALREIEKLDQAIKDAGHEDVPSKWPDGEDDEIVIKRVNAYDFNCSGAWGDPHFVAVEGLDGRVEISFDQRDDSGDDYEMRLHDVEEIELACGVFNAPRSIMAAIKMIKQHPVASC